MSLSPYVFQKLTDVFVNKLRDPELITSTGKNEQGKEKVGPQATATNGS